jgi:ABC-type uncharacterized transport system ATPase subunit
VAAHAVDRLLPEVVAAGLRVERFERVQPTLEDVFLELVGRRGGTEPGSEQ